MVAAFYRKKSHESGSMCLEVILLTVGFTLQGMCAKDCRRGLIISWWIAKEC